MASPAPFRHAWRPSRFTACRSVAAAVAASITAWAWAAPPLADPTRPPAALAAAPVAAAPAAAAQRPAGAPRQAAAPPVAPVLQALHLPVQGPSSAVVDGRIVRPGDRLGDRVVTAIDAQGLVLRTPGGSQRLWLLGSATKQLAGSVADTRSAQIAPAPSTQAATATAPSIHAGDAVPADAPGHVTQTAGAAPSGAMTLARRNTP